MKKIYLLLVIFLILETGMTANVTFAAESSGGNNFFAMSLSQWTARRYIINSPTFQFDGRRRTLKQTERIPSASPGCWEFVFEFDCANEGYGDRSDVEVAPAVTSHEARITVTQFRVTEAILDDRWDMVKQQLYGDSQPDPDPPATEEIETQVRGNSAFAVELYHELIAENDENIFYSPYSISLCLAMAYAGARGETETQMAETLHYDLSQARLHPVFKALSEELASRNHLDTPVRQGRGFKLNIANATWGQEGYPFLAEYLDILDRNYAGGLKTVDFTGDTEEARNTINQWVADQTQNRIPELIEPNVIDELTRLVLVNAVYFNAAWDSPFEEDFTRNEPFSTTDGREVTVRMMHQADNLLYSEGPGYQAVKLPYKKEELSMVILLPGQGQFESVESSLTEEKLTDIIGAMTSVSVAVGLPKFTVESSFDLNETLENLGMIDAFNQTAADLGGISNEKPLYISKVIHKSFVAVDEEGTEAAAATATSASGGGAPVEPVYFTADRPFIFLIQDHETGTILFLGRVMNPV